MISFGNQMSGGQEIAMHRHNLEIVTSHQNPGAKRIWCILTPVGGRLWKDSRNFVVCATFSWTKVGGIAPPVKVGGTCPCCPLFPPLWALQLIY